jgi:hypothetical protein
MMKEEEKAERVLLPNIRCLCEASISEQFQLWFDHFIKEVHAMIFPNYNEYLKSLAQHAFDFGRTFPRDGSAAKEMVTIKSPDCSKGGAHDGL